MFSLADIHERNKADVSKNENSMHKFVEDFNREIHNPNCPSIDLTLPGLNVSRGPHDWAAPLIRPSHLTLNNVSRKRSISPQKQNAKPLEKTNKDSSKTNHQFTLLPMPGARIKAFASTSNSAVSTERKHMVQNVTSGTSKNRKPDPQRLSLISGNVEYAIKMNKQYGQYNLLYEIYATVIRITQGKFACERVVLLRNEAGPILQAVFYEIDTTMEHISVGMNVRCVGKFQGSSRLHLFKVSQLVALPVENSLMRLQNLCNFTMNKRRDNN